MSVVSQGDTALRYVPQPSIINGSNTVIHSNISILGDDYQNDGDASEVDVSMCGIILRTLKQICPEFGKVGAGGVRIVSHGMENVTD